MQVPRFDIILRHAGTELARATLPPGEYVIGREPGVDVLAETPLLSRRHARLTINYDHLLLEDLGTRCERRGRSRCRWPAIAASRVGTALRAVRRASDSEAAGAGERALPARWFRHSAETNFSQRVE